MSGLQHLVCQSQSPGKSSERSLTHLDTSKGVVSGTMTGRLSIELPDKLRLSISNARGEANVPRWALEAVVVEALREGLCTRGYAGEVLGLSSKDRETFLEERGMPFDS